MTKRNRQWLTQHQRDRFFQRSKDEGFRSRAAYKLLEVERRDRVFRPGMTVVDLGASPGGWSQVAARRVAPGGRVLAVDIMPMKAIGGVEFLQGDFENSAVLKTLLATLGGSKAALVLSDMAPNVTGISAVDQPRALHLNDLALDFCKRVLAPGGNLLVKVFEGSGKAQFMTQVRGSFGQVLTRKPQASRQTSREVYLLARGYIV